MEFRRVPGELLTFCFYALSVPDREFSLMRTFTQGHLTPWNIAIA